MALLLLSGWVISHCDKIAYLFEAAARKPLLTKNPHYGPYSKISRIYRLFDWRNPVSGESNGHSQPSSAQHRQDGPSIDYSKSDQPQTDFPYYTEKRIDPEDPDLHFDPMDEGFIAEEAKKREESVFNQSGSVTPITLRFENLRFEVDIGDKKNPETKAILKGMNGQVEPASLLTIMGASGAGKTTLLNILAGRLEDTGVGHASGSILVNGEKRDYASFRKNSAYVLQQDIFFAELTVKETIRFSAELRLPREMSKEAKEKRVQSVITELGLNKCQDTIVGNEVIRGISGGERKRCNIGTELVTNPTLVFCDEPSSGLDAYNAQQTMNSLLTLSKAGRTVICTLHQPRSEIFGMMDQLMLLSEGYTMYFGPAKEAPAYFDQQGYPCPKSYNPCDWFLDVISLDSRDPNRERQTKKRVQYLAEAFKDYEHQHPLPPVEKRGRSVSDDNDGRTYAVSWPTQFSLLLKRAALIVKREKAVNMARLMQTLVFAVLLGLIWLQEGGSDSGRAVQSVSGVIFFLLINQSFGGVFSIIFVFPAEKSVVTKERSSKTYQVGAYFWSKMLVNLPRTFMYNLLFSLITYWMVGLRSDAGSFFGFVLIVFLATQAAESVAYIVSALSDTPQQAGAIAPVFIVTSILFGGFFIGEDAMPEWIGWLQYLSYFKYSFAALMQLEYEDRDLNTGACTSEGNFCPVDGEAVLSFYGLQEVSFAGNVFVLLGMAFGFRLIAYWVLRRKGPRFDDSI
eukprot:TRINITY_DN11938_c6_g1_i16.p1 TRINITY_DN11938_c6_g1~~TRINITY_DN11938_c6_g1_i16.p1  ORF type:complete len:739 (+),score=188.31 TRINITY_DN11938_c6_g1_i16:284-2500(+)